MRRYSIFHALLLSFFSRALYRDVARAWRGAGLLYLLLLASLPALLIVVHMELGLAHWVHTDGAYVAAQVPAIHIRPGVVQVDRPLPIVIRSRQGDVFAIIDTTGTEATVDTMGDMVLLARDRLYLHRQHRETRIIDLSTVTDFSLDRDRAQGWLWGLLFWSGPIALPFVLAGLFVFRLVQVLIGAGLALLLARGSRVPLAFDAGMRLVAVALTPAILVEAALDAAGVRPPYWGLAWSVIAIFCVVMVIRGYRDDAAAAGPAPAPLPGGQD